jgi:hypothetical protein
MFHFKAQVISYTYRTRLPQPFFMLIFNKFSGSPITAIRLQLWAGERLPGLMPDYSQKRIFKSGEWFSQALTPAGCVSRTILGA